jgi:hypothetical protein
MTKRKKHISPLKAIRKYCLWCCNYQPKEVRLCPAGRCSLQTFRMGKITTEKSCLQAIRERCLDCGEGTPQAVTKCEFPECDLYPFRQGKNPNRKGIGGFTDKRKLGQKNKCEPKNSD